MKNEIDQFTKLTNKEDELYVTGKIIKRVPHGVLIQWSDGTTSFTDEKIE
tara:strand:- start:1453 stop:1602 length:150 start_codon:yes stop_codon:yes gene_type:complete